MTSLPRRGGNNGLRRVIRHRSTTFSLQRPSHSAGRFGDESSTTTTISGVDLWLHPPRTMMQNTEFGDRRPADAVALGLDTADVQVNDRLTDGGTVYEVDDVEYLPNESEAEFIRVTFTARVND